MIAKWPNVVISVVIRKYKFKGRSVIDIGGEVREGEELDIVKTG